MDLGLKGKVALVAAASKGLGRAVAHELASEGARLAICARDARTLEAAARDIAAATGAEVLAQPADVSEPQAIAAFVDATASGLSFVPNDEPSDMLITSMSLSTAHSIASTTTSVEPAQPKTRTE